MSHYIFELSDKVQRKPVSYKNRYGITIAGELYVSKDFDESKKHPAIIVGAPYGGVKEQGPGVYANALAQRGFVVLTFDPSFMGESGGDLVTFLPLISLRRISAPAWIIWDFSALWTERRSAL